MTKKDKNILLGIGAVVLLFILSKRPVKKSVNVSYDFLLGAYSDLVTNRTDLIYEGQPLHIYLAQNTTDYAQVKSDYEVLYKKNLTLEILARLSAEQLSEFVAELWKNSEQVLFE